MSGIHGLENSLIRALGLERQRITTIDLHFAVHQDIPTAIVGMYVLDDVEGVREVFETYDLHPTLREDNEGGEG